MSTPIFRALKQIYPNSLVDALVIPKSSIVLQNNQYIDNILLFDKHSGYFSKIYNFFHLIRKIRKEKYQVGIGLQHSFTTSLILLAGGIKQRIGNKYLLFANTKIHLPKGLHIRQRVLEYLKPLSNKVFPDKTEIFFNENDISTAKDIMKNGEKVGSITIAPGSVWQTKKWSEEKFKLLAKSLADMGFNIYLIGSKEEFELNESIKKFTKSENVVNLAGKLTILESAAVIQFSDLLICNDSSPLHLANAVNTTVFAFFGPTVRRFGCYPYNIGDKVIEVDLDCRPCSKHGTKSCPLVHHDCLNKIEVIDVLNLVKSYFGKF